MEVCFMKINKLVEKIEDKKGLQYSITAILVILLYMISRALGLDKNVLVIKIGMLICLSIVIITLIVQWKGKNLTYKKAIRIIIFMGIVMRIGYMLYTPCNVRSHDLYKINVTSNGHAGYLLRLINNGTLPESNKIQLYQQPLFYLFGAFISKIINFILSCNEPFYLVDATKTVSCIASCLSILLCKSICEESGLEEKGEILPIMLMAFLPAGYLTGGRVTPDALAAMFMLFAFLYTLKWIKCQSWYNTIILAIIYGCAVMTKISSGVVAIGTAIIFIWKLYMELKKHKNIKPIILKYFVFSVISLPLGLWYGIRNYILFKQPLNYVLPIDKNSEIYTGMHSLVERFISIDFSNFFKGPYANPWKDYNAPVYFVKSSLFGEFTYNIPGWLPVLLMLFATLITVIVVSAIVWQFRSNGKDKMGNIACGMALLYYFSILYFYYKYPFGCSMDFRYMTFLVAPIGVLLGKYGLHLKEKGNSITVIFVCFSLLSCIMYCFI